MKRVLILTIVLIFCLAIAQAKYHLVKVFLNNDLDLQKLLSLSLDMESAIDGKNEISIIVNDSEKEALAKSGLKFDVLIEDYENYLTNNIKENEKKLQEETPQGFEFGSMGGFYTLEEIFNQFDNLCNTNYFVDKKTIGYSWENRPIVAYCFGSKDTTKPEVLITALHHSREPATVTTIVYFLQTLFNSATFGEPEAIHLLENRRIWVIPVLNPDGYLFNQVRYPNGGGMWRKNRRPINEKDTGVDLNRNYGPYEFWNANNNGSSTNPSNETYRGPAPFSEPEIVALRNFCLTRNFRLALNYHTYGGMLIYPYSALPYETPDSNWYRTFGIYIQPLTSYYFGTDRQTVGYPTRGSSDDWLYTPDSAKGKVLAFSPEASYQFDGFWPKKERIVPIAKENYPLLMNFLWSAGVNIRLFNFHYEFDTIRKIGFLELEFSNIGLESPTNMTFARIISNSGDYPFDTLLEIPNLRPAEKFSTQLQLPIPNDNFKNGSEIPFIISILQNNVERKDTINISLYEYLIVNLLDSTLWDFSTGYWGFEVSQDSAEFILCDSPFSNYKDSVDNYLILRAPYRLGANNFELELTSRWAIEPFYDFAKLEISTNSGKDWIPIRFKRSTIASGNPFGKQKLGEFGFAGYIRFWNKQIASLKDYLWKDVVFRLSVQSDRAKNSSGWDIKGLSLRSYPNVSFKNYVSTPQKTSRLFFFCDNRFIGSIEIPETAKIEEIKVFDILGRCVFSKYFAEPNQYIYLPKLTFGVYLVQISTGSQGHIFNKLIVK